MQFGLKQNNKRAKENAGGSFQNLPKGEYELIVNHGDMKFSQNGTPGINLSLTVRSDFDQQGKGRKLFHTFYISQQMEPKEGKEKSPYEYCMEMIEAFTFALGAPEGVEFNTPEAVINFAKGKPVRAYVGIREYNGKEYNEIKNFKASESPNVKPQDTTNGGANMQKTTAQANQQNNPDPFANDGTPIDITDDDLPF